MVYKFIRPSWVLLIIACVPQLGAGQTNKMPIESTLDHTDVVNIESVDAAGIRLSENAKNLVRATFPDGTKLDSLISADSQATTLLFPSGAVSASEVFLLFAENSVMLDDGTLILSALDAEISGEKAKLESNPGNHRIGFWTNDSDSVGWNLNPSRWGRYQVDLVYSQAGKSGTSVEVTIEPKGKEPKVYPVELKSTSSWYRYTTISIGEHYFDDQTYQLNHRVSVACLNKVGAAVMNLKAIVFRPVSEGEQPVHSDSAGNLDFQSRDATVIGTRLVYEPNPKKLTLGWWTKVNDKARWAFRVDQAGQFNVEILQGCGKGQGGSHVAIDVLHEHAASTEPNRDLAISSIKFTVEDTGHFQNFKSRTVGEVELQPGNYILQVRPLEKAKNAVMDLRQLRLLRK